MQKFISAAALSDFRLEKLLANLQTVQADIQKVAARFVHFVSGDLTHENKHVLEQLLSYGASNYINDSEGECLLIVPRSGTISPWSSKATDIAQRCGLHDIKRIERGIEYFIISSSLLENVAVGIVIIDPETRIIESVNSFGSTLIGETPDMIIGRRCHQYICPAHEKSCPVCDKGQDVDNSQRQLLRKDKTPLAILKTVKKIQIGGKEKLLESFVDISVQKMAEEAVIQSSKKWEAIISASPDGIGMASLDGKLQLMSDKLAAMYGYTIEEKDDCIGKPFWDFIDPSNHKILKDNIQKLLAGESDQKITEYIGIRKDNSLFYVDVNSTVLLDHNGNPLSILFIERDITNRKQADEERTRQAGLIRSLLDSIPDIIFFKDLNGVYLGGNPAFAEFSRRTQDGIIGMTDYDIFAKEIADSFREQDKRMIELRQPSQNDLWITNAEGGKTLRDTVKTPYLGPDGTLIGVIGIGRDITARKQAEETLHNERALFRTIIDLIPDAVYVKDINGRKIIANPKEVQYSGKNSEEEIIGKTDFQLYPDKEAKRALTEDQLVLESGKPIFNNDGTLIDKDGNLHWLLCSKVPLRDMHGKITGLVGVTHDITDRKKTEEALAQAADRLAMATHAGGVGIWDYDLVNNNLLWDNQMFALYGVEKNNSGGAYETWRAGVHPDDIVASDAEILMAINGDKEFNTEFRIIWPNGAVHNIRALAIVQRNSAGQPLRMVGTNWDITEQKKTEAALLNAKQVADIASKAKSEFLANMSHEIRTPLNGVIGFTDLLLKTPLNKIQQQYAENVNTSGHSLLGIINDILDFSKIEAGKMELDHIKTDIIELVEQTSDIIKYHASQKGLELLLAIQPDIPRFVVVDPIRLKQIIVNLLGNAVKFTEIGEVELKVTFTKKDKTIGKFRFSVRDTGIGINLEQQKKLFKAFTQADSSTTRKFGGTGLGLTISNMLAEKMGSKIEIVSEIGVGSNFFFTLETEYECGEKLLADSLININRVLVIDDNDNNRLILEHTFKNWGIEFVGIDNGLSALKIIEKSKLFDVVIVDFHMPYLNGLDTIKMIREQLNLSPEKQPIILLHSSADDIEIYEKCKQLGVRFNLTKPVKAQELLHYLKSIHNQPIQSSKETKVELQDFAEVMVNDVSPIILVAEDVALNMLLVTTIIRQMIPNVIVFEAKNGKEALDLTLSNKPDLIFMDVQMPVMSGIESALQIRKYENGSNKRIPIVALTAGAIKGEKEKCIEAGMDDFLTKPIDQEALNKILKKHLMSFYDQSVNSSEKTGQNTSKLHFDEKLLMENIGNSQVLLEELLEVVPIQFAIDIESLDKAITQNNLKGITRAAHSIKGASLNMCFVQLAELAHKIELEYENIENVTGIFNELVLEWEYIQLLLKNMKIY